MSKIRAGLPSEVLNRKLPDAQHVKNTANGPAELPKEYTFHSSNFPYRLNALDVTKPAPEIMKPYSPPLEFNSPPNAKSLRVTFLGPSNSGRSTIINRVLGRKLAPASALLSTTKDNSLYWFLQDNCQVIISDTPGIKKIDSNSDNRPAALKPWLSLNDVDYAVVVMNANEFKNVDGNVRIPKDSEWILKKLRTFNVPSLLVINKMDKKPYDVDVLAITEACTKAYHGFAYTLQMNAKESAAELKDLLVKECRSRPWEYPNERYTTNSNGHMACDFMREQLFRVCGMFDIPLYVAYKIKVRLTGWTYLVDNQLRVDVHATFPNEKSLHAFANAKRGFVPRQLLTRAAVDFGNFIGRKTFIFMKCTVA